MPPDQGEEQEPAMLEECRTRAHWLQCPSIFDMLRPEAGAAWAGNADYLDFVIDPASGVNMPQRGQWVTATGSFDHPEAQACGDVFAVVTCRYRFVVTSVVPG